MLHHHTSGLEATGHEREVADRWGDPLLAYVVPNRGLSHRDLAKQRIMVKREDYIKRAIRAHLNAPLPDLVNDVKVMPIKQGGHLTHHSLVELPLARDWGVSSGARHREAAVRVPAIPDNPPRPRLEHLLPKDPSGDGGWAGSRPDGGRSSVSEGKPSENLFRIDAREEQGGTGR